MQAELETRLLLNPRINGKLAYTGETLITHLLHVLNHQIETWSYFFSVIGYSHANDWPNNGGPIGPFYLTIPRDDFSPVSIMDLHCFASLVATDWHIVLFSAISLQEITANLSVVRGKVVGKWRNKNEIETTLVLEFVNSQWLEWNKIWSVTSCERLKRGDLTQVKLKQVRIHNRLLYEERNEVWQMKKER